ncbi:MAG: ABC transporter substrate-binding protein [Actinomycetota bacterium]
MKPSRRTIYAGVLAFGLLLSGCSSTNEITSQQALTEGEAGPVPSFGPGGPATPRANSGTRTVTSTEGGSTIPGGPPVVPGGGPVRMGRGVTATSIKIGFNITKNLSAALVAVGFGGGGSGEFVGEERPIVDALIKQMNKGGGIAGRKIEPVFFEYDATQAQGWDALAAQACATFIEDNEVFAVVSGHVGQTDTLLSCLAEGGVPLVQQNQWPYDGEYFNSYAGWFYQPSRMRPERWVPQYIDGLKGAGYFTSGYKLGLIRFDAPVFGRIEKMIRSTLKSRGLNLTDVSVIGTPQSVGQFSAMSGELSNTILQFRSKGITHVIFDEYAAIIPFFFLTQAESQRFRPRYGFTSVNLPGTNEQQHGPPQLHGSISVSWLPGQDFFADAPKDPRITAGGAFQRCMKLLRDELGLPASRLYGPSHCDNLFFLESALGRTNDITPAGLRASAESLGTSYDSPYTWSTRFGPGRTDGASKTMLSKYDDGCECFKFSNNYRDAG